MIGIKVPTVGESFNEVALIKMAEGNQSRAGEKIINLITQ